MPNVFKPGDRVRYVDFMDSSAKKREAIMLPDCRVWDIEEGCSEPVNEDDCELVTRAVYMTPEHVAVLEAIRRGMCEKWAGVTPRNAVVLAEILAAANA